MLKNNFSTPFPNIYILLRHYLTLPVTNCTGERSFSHLKRIKSTLGSTQTQERLNDLTLLNIECDLLQKLDFYEIIDAFSSAKCRKRCFWSDSVLDYVQKLLLLSFFCCFTTFVINTKNHVYASFLVLPKRHTHKIENVFA